MLGGTLGSCLFKASEDSHVVLEEPLMMGLLSGSVTTTIGQSINFT